MKHQAIVDRMSLAAKLALCSGAGPMRTAAFDEHDIPEIRMADGPHGLRKTLAAQNQLGINDSVPATCFPTASLSACSWDRELLFEMGAAIGEEALQEGIDIVLGPGVNIKRNPLCGRNFEYFSEDPCLAGELAAAWIRGIQSQGVGASLKHFAANSQENARMASDSVVDERTLREIYLPAFEKAVRAGRPATVMAAYNKLNGTFCGDNRRLLTDILRHEWGFEGAVLSDWGASHDRVAGFDAGLDLEMPGSKGYFDAEVAAAVGAGRLAVTRLDESADRLVELARVAAANRRADYRYDVDAHHRLAQRIAAESAVLLRNEARALPLQPGQRIALIGALARVPRYQGAGSSHINPTRLASPIDGFSALGLDFKHYEGYPLRGPTDPALLAEAVDGARRSDVAVIFAGLPEAYESEGFDRATLTMPDSHNALIAAVAAANPNTVVALVGGAPVEMPWLAQVKAVLHLYLPGQAGGLAAAELLTGRVNPSGKLAESYPIRYADVPSAGFWEHGGKQAQYREAVYVGYRYYDKAGAEVLFPFGHGLSYTTFEYCDLDLSASRLAAPYELRVTFTIRNTGGVDGAEVAQIYVGEVGAAMFRPARELREFVKARVAAGGERQVTVALDGRAFACYDPALGGWVVPGGVYRISVGASSRDIRLQADVTIDGAADSPAARPAPAWYLRPTGSASQADFEALLGRRIEPVRPPRKGEYTLDCSFDDMRGSFVVRQIIRSIERRISAAFGGPDSSNPTYRMMMVSATTMPLRAISLNGPDDMPRNRAEAIVHLANGRVLDAARAFMRRDAGRASG